MPEIREMTKDDIPQAIELGRIMHGYSTFKELSYCEAHMAKELIRHILSDNCLAMVAVTEGQIVAGLAGQIKETYFGDDTISIDTFIYVVPKYQKKGLAENLISRFSEWSYQNGVKRCFVGSLAGTDTNPNGIQGFEFAGNLIARNF